MVRQYVGRHWSENGSKEKVPLNLIAHYVQVMSRHLVAKNPRVLLSTFKRQHKPTVYALQDWANQNIERENVAEKIRRAVTDALFSIGILKVSIATPGEAVMSGWETLAGQPTIQRIDLDDFFYDRQATTFQEVSRIGHRYRIPREVAIKMIGKRAKNLAASEMTDYNETGDERIGTLGRNLVTPGEDFEDMVDLWEVYLPRHRRVLTLADGIVTGSDEADHGDYEPLLDQPWVGPYCGPYHILSYGVVPGNAMPKAPLQDLYDLHLAVNQSLRKIVRTTERIKEVALVAGAAAEDGKRVIEASDGEMIKVQNLQGMQQVVFSGQHLAPIQAITVYLDGLFNQLGGNLALLSGSAPQAKTATQDKMLNENAGTGVADKQDTTLTFVSNVLESWIWFHHYDPYTVQRTVSTVGEKDIVRDIYPNQPEYTDPEAEGYQGRPLHVRESRWEDLRVRVDPYSMQHQTPQTKMNFLITTVTQLITPILPLLQQQGISIDMNTFLKKIGEYADQPDLDEVLTIMEAPAEGAGGGSHERTMAPSTHRTTERVNRSEQTQDSANRNMVTGLLGLNTGGSRDTAKTP